MIVAERHGDTIRIESEPGDMTFRAAWVRRWRATSPGSMGSARDERSDLVELRPVAITLNLEVVIGSP